MASETVARPRRRTSIASLPQVQKPSDDGLSPADSRELELLMIEAYQLNQESNEASKKYTKTRARLLTRMQELGKKDHIITFKKGAHNLTLESIISSPVTKKIDVVKLFEKVDKQQFLQIVSASVTSVTEVAGSTVANICAVDQTGKENVTVQVKK